MTGTARREATRNQTVATEPPMPRIAPNRTVNTAEWTATDKAMRSVTASTRHATAR